MLFRLERINEGIKMNRSTVKKVNTIVKEVFAKRDIPNWLFLIYRNVAVRYAKWIEKDGLNAKNTIVNSLLSTYDKLDKNVFSEIFSEIERRIFAHGND